MATSTTSKAPNGGGSAFYSLTVSKASFIPGNVEITVRGRYSVAVLDTAEWDARISKGMGVITAPNGQWLEAEVHDLSSADVIDIIYEARIPVERAKTFFADAKSKATRPRIGIDEQMRVEGGHNYRLNMSLAEAIVANIADREIGIQFHNTGKCAKAYLPGYVGLWDINECDRIAGWTMTHEATGLVIHTDFDYCAWVSQSLLDTLDKEDIQDCPCVVMPHYNG
jgi:hypothetical protein